MKSFAEEFVGLNQLSKTLKFELVPQGRTVDLLSDLPGSMLDEDRMRAQEYKKVKLIIDDYYRHYLTTVLTESIIDQKSIQIAYDAYVSEDKVALQVIQKKLRETISDELDKKRADFALSEYSKLLSTKETGKYNINLWLKEQLKNGTISQDAYVQKIDSLAKFNNFTTYFTGFKDNRDNMFSKEEHGTAVSYRIAHENMLRFFSNYKLFLLIQKKYSGLYSLIEHYASKLQIEAFAHTLTQSAIADYNNILGNTNMVQDRGINSLINEYRQQNNLKARELPVMAVLYKQILSIKDDSIFASAITNDIEMLETANNCMLQAQQTIQQLQALLADYLTDANLDSIFIKTNKLSEISQKLYGDWSIIPNALNSPDNTAVISLQELNQKVKKYISELDGEIKDTLDKTANVSSYFLNPPELIPLSAELNSPTLDQENKKHYLKISLDSILAAVNFYKHFHLFKDGKPIHVNNDEGFYHAFCYLFAEINENSKTYDNIRNYITQKPYSIDKFKVNFNTPTLLSGWDKNKEEANLNILLIKDEKFYLAIMHHQFRQSFDFNKPEIKKKAITGQDFYRKIEYKQVSGASKMLPKVFFAEINQSLYQPSAEIENIRKNKLHTKDANDIQSTHKWIAFNQDCIQKHPEWNNYFQFKFKAPTEYKNIVEFYSDFDKQAYSLRFVDVSVEYIDELVRDGKLFLFQIYNKDFSPYSKGKPNLHTLYWKALFASENLAAIFDGSNRPLFKLNGEAEIFYRPASITIPKTPTHPKHIPIANKNKLSSKSSSTFDIDLYKNKRFMNGKFFFHCPITINFRAPKTNASAINAMVNRFATNNNDIKIIGIDRGERHLLYYTLINNRGEILERASLNTITNTYLTADKAQTISTDYHQLLDTRSAERMESRKSWGTIENIKELKSGYLSQVVNKITTLAIKYNAIIVLEDLNAGFKRGRIKVEKQVYQKFEKALIDKLNYLSFKDTPFSQVGSILQGYQLAAPFESFSKLFNQSGIIYYVNPAYTSHICPKTGFVDLLRPKYKNVNEAQIFFSKFDKICYNPQHDYFEFELDYKNFNTNPQNLPINNWIVCTHGKDRYFYSRHAAQYTSIDVTAAIKALLDKNNIAYNQGEDIRDVIKSQSEKTFLESLLFYLRITLQMRYTKDGTEDSSDFILSPIAVNGNFFDSRTALVHEPNNADANGAYHIALKGLQLISHIENGKLKRLNKEAWFEYVQYQQYKS